jgi:hypothetical protein
MIISYDLLLLLLNSKACALLPVPLHNLFRVALIIFFLFYLLEV